MSLRILALLPEARCAPAALEAAAAAARIDPGASITALHVLTDPLRLHGSEEEIAFQRLREPIEGTAEDRARATQAEYDRWLDAAPPGTGARIRYEELAGTEEDVVAKQGRNAGLVAMARPANLDSHDAFHAVIFLTGTLLLLAPADWKAEAGARLERHMLVAWKETSQARRALAGALPWLKAAGQVTLLTVAKGGREPDPSDALSLLEQAGVRAERLSGEPVEGRTSARILATAQEIGASAVVMGAYRHGPMLEWALGATTKRTITGTHIPLFFAH